MLVYIRNFMLALREKGVRAAAIERNSCEEASAAILREQY
jgi:hypothetical protein